MKPHYALLLTCWSYILASCSTPAPAKPAAEVQREEGEERMVCGAVQAYAISKGIVKQAIHGADAVVFPSFETSMVSEGGEWYTVNTFFFRNSERVPYEIALGCVGGKWQVAYVKVNGVDAKAGDNL